MAQPYIGEIRMFAGNFAPAGWLMCDGSLVPISENDALFTLIGTTYGGDGQENFAVPDLRGRIPVHMGNNFQIGQAAGTESVTLTIQQMPSHTHQLLTSAAVATLPAATNGVLARSTKALIYYADTPKTPMNAAAITLTGGSQPHDNMQPFLCINFIISQFGIFPSPT